MHWQFFTTNDFGQTNARTARYNTSFATDCKIHVLQITTEFVFYIERNRDIADSGVFHAKTTKENVQNKYTMHVIIYARRLQRVTR